MISSPVLKPYMKKVSISTLLALCFFQVEFFTGVSVALYHTDVLWDAGLVF